MDIDKFISNIIREEVLSHSKMMVNEKLSGNQKKLDKNKNNKIDSGDFKILRGNKKSEVKEKDEKWIQKAVKHPGALHKALDVPEGEKIPKSLLHKKKKELENKSKGDKKLSASDSKLLKQINFALNVPKLNESNRNTLVLKESELIDLIESIVVEEKASRKKASLKENTKKTLVLKESELIDLIEEIIMEQKLDAKVPEGMRVTTKNQTQSKKENDSYLKDVSKKMKDYVGKMYDPNPKSFPKSNGGDRMKYQPSDAVDEYIENLAQGGGMENLKYDEIEPNEEWVTNNIEGSSVTGNNPEWANAEETDLGKRVNKKRKANLFGQEKAKSYNRVSQPVDTTGKDKKGGALDKIFSKLESVKSNPVIAEEIEKMKYLFNYREKKF